MPNLHRPTILIIDDIAENLGLLNQVLKPHYEIRAANSGEKALRIARNTPAPDLILLDVMMPGMDGYQVFEALRADLATRDIPVIFVTAMDGREFQLRGLDLRALDYITKPIDTQVLLARIRNQMEFKQLRDRLKDQNAWLDAEVKRRMAENDLIQLVSIRALAHLAEIRDPETGNHILRTQGYVGTLAKLMQIDPRFTAAPDGHYIDLLTRSAPLHDIGKVGIPDSILQKKGKLTAEEWQIMKTHSQMGAWAIELAEHDAHEEVEFLKLAKEIAHWHHERWDGTGYPDGLAGEAIPLSARLMSLADVFDALISPRVYKPALSYEQAREIIAEGSGKHFDPVMCALFLENYEAFVAIADCYGEGNLSAEPVKPLGAPGNAMPANKTT